jgi:hypothetical protein
VTTAQALAASTAPATKPVTPPPVTTAQALASSPAPRSVTPGPFTTAKAVAASTGHESVAPAATAKPATPVPSAKPAATHPKVETAPLPLIASAGKAGVRFPGPPAPVNPPTATVPQSPADGHERAKRRARVILSDLTAYHRDELVKAAHAADPRKELGTLWRDAVISYNEAAPPEIRGVTNYLEDELSKQLAELRQANPVT